VTAEGTVTTRAFPLPGPRIPLIVGVAALVVCALYALYSPASFFRAYLISFLMWIGVSVGALAIVGIGRLTGGHWAAQLRPVLGPAARAVPLLLLLFLPLLLGLHLIFPWANAEMVANDAELRQKTVIYLNVPGFIIRATFYFAAWIGFAYVVTPSRPAGSPPLSFAEKRRLGMISALALGFFGLTVTFASIDWAMSLEPEPRWFSTIYGVMWAVGMILSAFSFGVAYVCAFNPDADKQVLRDLGNLLMAFTLVWVYMAFSQYLLIWSGNLREEIPWYVRRGQGVWSGIAFLLTVFQFAVPFAILLSGQVKTNPRALLGVALLVFFMRFVDIFWLTAPAFPNHGDLFFLQPLAFVGIGGLWIAAFLWLKPSTVPDVVSVAEPAGELAHE
jgi:hypothetical protein